MAKPKYNDVSISNKKASFEFEIIDRYTAGLVLRGSEIKSVRDGKVALSDAFCFFKGDELFIKNLNISEFKQATIWQHEPLRLRKLLLNRKELNKLLAKVKERGFTIVPLRIFLTERGFAKIDIALSRGKKVYDKRDSIKKRDEQRDLDRTMLKYK